MNKLKLFFKKLYLKLFKRGIYYVNGPMSLPEPLTKERELELSEKLASGDASAREELIVHNLRLVVYIAKKFESTGVNIEDLISIGTIGLIKSVNTFCPGKNIKLATYASRCIENEILMHLRKIAPQKMEISLDEPLNIDWDGNELMLCDVLGSDSDEINREIEEEDEKRMLLKVIDTLPERERIIIDMRFGLGDKQELTQKEVADKLGISQSYISRLEKRIIKRIGDKMKAQLKG
ncbi:MAG: RNA polymerase sporulation sigma factor SigE [Oscillospiraceae bacterium]|nr:RNA polymerase sporulation sigma factor SigE [Oscillospiraceae bacterium]